MTTQGARSGKPPRGLFLLVLAAVAAQAVAVVYLAAARPERRAPAVRSARTASAVPPEAVPPDTPAAPPQSPQPAVPSAQPSAQAAPPAPPPSSTGGARLERGPTRCGRYSRGGSVHPVCKPGTAGSADDVVVETIPGTNITVNKAWAPNVTALLAKGRRAGFNLQGMDIAGPGYASFRTKAMQASLVRRGYPANPVGTSMHEWGLAIDFACNGAKFNDPANGRCRHWVQANAGAFGLYVLPSEPWHWSSNGA